MPPLSHAVKIGRSIAEMLQFFVFSRWPQPPSWFFEIVKFYWLFGLRGLRNFCQNRSIGRKDIMIFWFFKMAAAVILDFRNREFLFADDILRAQTLNKFCQNRSFLCGDIAIFQIVKFSTFYWLSVSGGAICILSLIHIWRCRRSTLCRSRWSPYH